MIEKYIIHTRRWLACARMALNQISRLSLDPLPRSCRIGEREAQAGQLFPRNNFESFAGESGSASLLGFGLLAGCKALVRSECAVCSHSEQHPFLKESATEQRDSQHLGLVFQPPWEAGGRAERHASVSSSWLLFLVLPPCCSGPLRSWSQVVYVILKHLNMYY